MGQKMRTILRNKMMKNKRGFTLIELIMVILLVAILAVVAIPQFIDYRLEAKNATTVNILGTLRTGIALQYGQSMLRCDQTAGVWPSLTALNANDMSAVAPCNAGQIVTAAEVQFIAQPTIPANPWGSNGTVVACVAGQSCLVHCDPQGCDNVAAAGGWCYNAATGEIWGDTSETCGF